MDACRTGERSLARSAAHHIPACSLCGAPLYAAAAYTDLQKRAQAALQELVALSEHRAFLVGMPLQIQDKGLCNAIVFVQNGAIRGVVTKKYLGVDEQKYFVRGEGVQLIEFHDQRLPSDSTKTSRN